MRIIFFGLGSIGERHVKALQENYHHELFAFRSRESGAKNSLHIREVFTWKEVEQIKPDVAFITNPTAKHIETATQCAKRGMHLFIEKPIDSEAKHLNQLLKIVSNKKLTTYVAYVLRFHPVVQTFKKYAENDQPLHMRVWTSSYLPKWRKGNDHLKRYSAQTQLGGGVIWDLSHEFDYAQFILGDIQTIKGQFSRRSQLTVNTEDYADILVETKKAPVNIHLNFFSHIPQRIIQIDFKDKTIVGDLIDGTLAEYRKGKLFKKIQFKSGYQESFDRQLKYFFKNIYNPKMMNNLNEAAPLFRKIYTFKNKGAFGG